jgi:hypothetical protein
LVVVATVLDDEAISTKSLVISVKLVKRGDN